MLKRLLLPLAIILLNATSLISAAHAADSYSVAAGASVAITEHTVCHVVTNGLAQSLFVPTKSATEWTSFRTNVPPGVTSVACDTTPNAFTFIDVTGANLSTLTTATAITIGGINTSTPVSVTGTGATISINGGAWVTSGTITNGQTLRVRITSANAYSTARTATVNVGGITDAWSVTTRAANNCTVASGTTWTVSSSTCTTPSVLNITHGSTGSRTDSTAPTTGTKMFSCTDGVVATSGTPTCTTASGGTWVATMPCKMGASGPTLPSCGIAPGGTSSMCPSSSPAGVACSPVASYCRVETDFGSGWAAFQVYQCQT